MTKAFFKDVFALSLDQHKDRVVYIGDSPNDSPMFAYFPHGVGVANVKDFQGQMTDLPTWITEQPGGFGFAEMVEQLLG